LFAYGIFKVIYAPHKAFKEIIQNPKYIGPLLILILFTVANIGFVYALISKTYVEQTLPTAEQKDIWTENATLWTGGPGVIVSNNYNDYINGTYYGNKSMEFSIVNSKQIFMQINDIGPVNCSEPDGNKDLYLRIKWTSPEDKPENATIYLFTTTLSDYFYYDFTENLNSTGNIWNNLTIPLATDTWHNNNTNANWANVTGLKLDFVWPNNSNITVLVDGLFFGGIFKSPVENITNYVINYSTASVMQFVIRWVLLGGLVYIISKAFKGKIVWKPLLIVVGFALITMFIEALMNAALFTTLPTLYYRFSFLGGVNGESVRAYNEIMEQTWLVSQISGYIHIAAIVWTIALTALAIRLLAEFTWTKSFLVAAVAYFAAMLAQSFILGF
jgi:hypothetical protein